MSTEMKWKLVNPEYEVKQLLREISLLYPPILDA